MPIYLADYVLMAYGTGAIMAVPGEDQRDWDFATAYDLPIVRTVAAARGLGGRGLHRRRARTSTAAGSTAIDKAEATRRPSTWLEEQGIGERKVNYRLRDWLVSRQRFWGCPIPVVYCPDHGIVPVPEDQLPVLAPDDVEFLPTGESPLRYHEGFLHTTCPICGGPGRARDRHHGHLRRLVVVLPALLRPVDAEDVPVQPGRRRALDAGRPVHRRHRARHPAPALRPLLHPGPGRPRLAPTGLREPFKRLFTQGMIRMGGTKMSKSKGNLIAPTEYFDTVGADALRLFHLFVGPPTDDFDWTSRPTR